MARNYSVHLLNHPFHKYKRLITLVTVMNTFWLLRVRSSEQQTLGGKSAGRKFIRGCLLGSTPMGGCRSGSRQTDKLSCDGVSTRRPVRAMVGLRSWDALSEIAELELGLHSRHALSRPLLGTAWVRRTFLAERSPKEVDSQRPSPHSNRDGTHPPSPRETFSHLLCVQDLRHH